MFPVFLVSAMRAYGNRLKTTVLTMWTLNEVSLWPREDVYDETYHAGHHDEYHPDYGAIHASIPGISSHPNKQGNIQGD
jgi:hypothetical protein